MLKSMYLRRRADDQLEDGARFFPNFHRPEILRNANDFPHGDGSDQRHNPDLRHTPLGLFAALQNVLSDSRDPTVCLHDRSFTGPVRNGGAILVDRWSRETEVFSGDQHQKTSIDLDQGAPREGLLGRIGDPSDHPAESYQHFIIRSFGCR